MTCQHQSPLHILQSSTVCHDNSCCNKNDHLVYDSSTNSLLFYQGNKHKNINPKIINVGSGVNIAKHKTCCRIPLKSLVQGNGITIQDLENEIKISNTNVIPTIRGETITLNETPTILFEIPIQQNSAMAIVFVIIAAEVSTGLTSSFFINKVFKRIGDFISQVPMNDKSEFIELYNTSVYFLPSEDSIKIIVNGISGKTINWSGRAELQNISF